MINFLQIILLSVLIYISQFCSSALNVHIVCHTHDDWGWLKTPQQYYLGANNSIQHAGVQYILDSVILALNENPSRRFVYVEQGFFQLWWSQQSESKRSQVRTLVSRGQLDFLNGGWTMPDEAATIAVDLIENAALGHKFLIDEFNYIPRTGWQIDPTGFS